MYMYMFTCTCTQTSFSVHKLFSKLFVGLKGKYLHVHVHVHVHINTDHVLVDVQPASE